MKCSKCGLVLPDDSEFCQYCGVKLDQDVAALDSIEVAEVTPILKTLTEQDEPLDASADAIAEPQLVEEVYEPIDASEELAAPIVVADAHLPNDSAADGRAEPSITSTPLISQAPPDAMTPSKKANKKKIKQRYCKFCGHKIDYKTKKCTGWGKQYLRWKRLLPMVSLTLVLLLIISITLNVSQYLSIITLKEDIAFLNKIETTLSMMGISGPLGMDSDNFKAEHGVVVLQANGAKKEMLLTAGISRNKLLLIQNSDNDVATVTAARKTSTTSTITITPLKKGTTVATFYSSYDSSSFKVLIIVTD